MPNNLKQAERFRNWKVLGNHYNLSAYESKVTPRDSVGCIWSVTPAFKMSPLSSLIENPRIDFLFQYKGGDDDA